MQMMTKMLILTSLRRLSVCDNLLVSAERYVWFRFIREFQIAPIWTNLACSARIIQLLGTLSAHPVRRSDPRNELQERQISIQRCRVASCQRASSLLAVDATADSETSDDDSLVECGEATNIEQRPLPLAEPGPRYVSDKTYDSAPRPEPRGGMIHGTTQQNKHRTTRIVPQVIRTIMNGDVLKGVLVWPLFVHGARGFKTAGLSRSIRKGLECFHWENKYL